MNTYTVARDGQELGTFEMAKIQEGMKTGNFKPTDWAWKEGMDEWVRLSALVGAPAVGSVVSQPASAKPVAAAPSQPAVNPYAAPASTTMRNPMVAGAVPYPVLQELRGTQPWVRFISILMWIMSILNLLMVLFYMGAGLFGAGLVAHSGSVGMGLGSAAFSLVFGGISAMLVLYPTLKLSKYASTINRLSSSQSYTDLTLALAEQRRFWKFCGILIAIYLVIFIAFLLLIFFTSLVVVKAANGAS